MAGIRDFSVIHMKLTDNEKASLKAFEGKKGKFRYTLMLFAPIFFIIMAIANFYAANYIGMYEGHNIINLFSDWIEGFESNKTYSYTGIYLKAVERFETAWLLIVVAILMGTIAIINIKERTRNRKIVEILKKHNEWND